MGPCGRRAVELALGRSNHGHVVSHTASAKQCNVLLRPVISTHTMRQSPQPHSLHPDENDDSGVIALLPGLGRRMSIREMISLTHRSRAVVTPFTGVISPSRGHPAPAAVELILQIRTPRRARASIHA